jgi:hypothetical protein
MSLIKLSEAGKNLIIPGQGELWLVTPRLGTGKSITFFTVQPPPHWVKSGNNLGGGHTGRERAPPPPHFSEASEVVSMNIYFR